MVAEIIDGKKIAGEIRTGLKPRLAKLADAGNVPGLAAVLVGENAASQLYVKMKSKASEEMGMAHWTLKDVDCFHPVNVGLVLIGRPRFAPATPSGVVELLMRSGNDPGGKDVVILGRSNIVGKPLAALLMQKAPGANATVTIAHTATKDIAAHTRRADILAVAMGSPRFLKADMVRKGAVVIDVGINRIPDPGAKGGYRTVGDVDFDAVKERAKAISPVPGGVGPMTIAMLLSNTVSAAEMASKAAGPTAP